MFIPELFSRRLLGPLTRARSSVRLPVLRKPHPIEVQFEALKGGGAARWLRKKITSNKSEIFSFRVSSLKELLLRFESAYVNIVHRFGALFLASVNVTSNRARTEPTAKRDKGAISRRRISTAGVPTARPSLNFQLRVARYRAQSEPVPGAYCHE